MSARRNLAAQPLGKTVGSRDDVDFPPLPATDNGPDDETEHSSIVPLQRKISGAYYTPDVVAAALCRWAVRSDSDLLLDPACGDGRFIARQPNSIGVDQELVAVLAAVERAPRARVYHADFFSWAAEANDRFDCVVGNPPFIRYQRFTAETRSRALALAAKNGAVFSRLTSAWAPFLVVAASLLRNGGRAAFVVPAEIGHAPYAVPVLEYFTQNFALVQVIAIRKKLFPNLSEDCWLLYAEDFGARTDEILFSAVESFYPTMDPPSVSYRVSLSEWRNTWKRRLRPLLLPREVRRLYQYVATRPTTKRFSDLASIGIGYVSGGNDFFHIRPSKANELALPASLLQPTLRNSRYLVGASVSFDLVERWQQSDEPVLLLNIPKHLKEVPKSVSRYLNSEEGEAIRWGYKCRNREPWYSVPDVHVPEFFLTYLSGRQVSLVHNDARITCTNALHYVRLKEQRFSSYIASAWRQPFTQLSCEVEGHPLGGGVLKLEPREAGAVLLTSASDLPESAVTEGLSIIRSWRHCSGGTS